MNSVARSGSAGNFLTPAGRLAIGKPGAEDGAAIHRLVGACRSLDQNSLYAYLLLCHHHAETCVLAREGRRLVGFASAYFPPAQPDVIFVWQVAVHPDRQGRGLGRALLAEMMSRPAVRDARYLETTVSPSNQASRALFNSLARKLGAPCVERDLFDARLFHPEIHETEVLLRIGPIKPAAVPITGQDKRWHMTGGKA